MAQAVRCLASALSSCRIGASAGNKFSALSQSYLPSPCTSGPPLLGIRQYHAPGKRPDRTPKIWIKPDIPLKDKAQENLSEENVEFLQTLVTDHVSPLKAPPPERSPFTFRTKRTGVIGKKLGVMPQWLANGKRIRTTVVQVVDNHVVSSSTAEQFAKQYKATRYKPLVKKVGCMVVGAESIDPTNLTDEYVKLFEPAGLQPKRKLTKFVVTEDALLQPGTAIRASHFRVGDYVDVGGKTVDYGFQGVMKRWGFKGGPASHGATKFHRRPGNIGHGRHNSKVMKGKKMPGWMGDRYRVARALQIVRMNARHDVLYIRGCFPGSPNSWCYLFDTVVKPKRPMKNPPPMPTHYPEDDVTPQPEEAFVPALFQFDKPSIIFEITEDDLKQKVRTGAKTAQKAPAKAAAAKSAKPPAKA